MAASSSDEAKKALAKSIAQARQQYLVAGQVLDQVMTRVKKELTDNMLLLGPDGQPILSERGVPMVPDSKIVQFVEFKKGLIQVDLAMAAANKVKEMSASADTAASSSSASATAEVKRLTTEIENVQVEVMNSMSEAMKIFQQACFGGPLSEAEYRALKQKMDTLGQDSINRMLSMIATPALQITELPPTTPPPPSSGASVGTSTAPPSSGAPPPPAGPSGSS